MDTRNYASPEAARRLHKAGIVLETEAYWWKAHKRIDWILQYKNVGIGDMLTQSVNCVPAPCMAEVWGELPECIPAGEIAWSTLLLRKYGDITKGEYNNGGAISAYTNPTDALIDLLIWVRKEADHE